jgi:tRNA(fMet)-specific endonuclease VapC
MTRAGQSRSGTFSARCPTTSTSARATRGLSANHRWVTSDRVYLLDTNIVSLALRGHAPRVVERLRATERDDVAISVVTAMELRFGVAKNPSTRVRTVVEEFLDTIHVLTIDRALEKPYAEIRAALERRGRPIGALDTIIAAHAVAVRAVLVTNNLREFRRVRGLRCQDWATSR